MNQSEPIEQVPPTDETAAAVPVLEIDNLHTQFFTSAGVVRAVDGVSYTVNNAETLGVVGESGCGKSVTALSVMRLVADPPGRIVDGSIRFGVFHSTDNIRDGKIRSHRIGRPVHAAKIWMNKGPSGFLTPVRIGRTTTLFVSSGPSVQSHE